MSQAVDLDHPRALDFLKEDAAHINAFFRRAGIAVLTTRQLFDFTVDPSINQSNLHEAVETLQQLAVRCSTHTVASATVTGCAQAIDLDVVPVAFVTGGIAQTNCPCKSHSSSCVGSLAPYVKPALRHLYSCDSSCTYCIAAAADKAYNRMKERRN